MILKTFKHRIYPNKEQQELIQKHIGCCRYIYNKALEYKIKEYTENNKSHNYYDLQNEFLRKEKEEHEWLREITAQSLQMSLRHLDNAFTRFFREKKGFPKFKSRKNPVQSIQFPQYVRVDFEKKRTIFPKLGGIFTVFERKFEGKVKICTVSKTKTGKYYVSILVELPTAVPKKPKLDKKKAVGIDLGLKHFIITSQGDKVENPKYLKKSIDRLVILQKRASKKQKGSENRKKANLKVAKCYENISFQRKDFLQKLSSKLISENQTICLEDLNVCGMVRNHKLARSISDASWSSFVNMLEYKAEWYGINIIKIGRFYPSSKMCSVCGKINNELVLNDREWECESCKTVHDRDVNAGINIKNFAFQKQNLVYNSGSERSSESVEMSVCKKNRRNRKPLPLGIRL